MSRSPGLAIVGLGLLLGGCPRPPGAARPTLADAGIDGDERGHIELDVLVPARETQLLPRKPEAAAPTRLAWPVKGIVRGKFGLRDGQPHEGIDVAAPEGTLVFAAAEGRVIFAGEQSGYGRLAIVRHQSALLTVYAHASELLVKEGDVVRAGTPIARVGRTGRASGPHLHFEVREGIRAVDPLPYLGTR